MTKERTELQHKINALVDPLSGVANRRAFLEGARRLMVQQALDGEPAGRFASGDLAPTVSAGVTVGMHRQSADAAHRNSNDAKTRVDTLLEVADRALYRAKANGRNRVEATAALEDTATSLACAPSIVPLIKAERLSSFPVRAWRRRATH
jgi:GGDEF domain-containing protein